MRLKEREKKRIFWFEDDAVSLEDFHDSLQESYILKMGAHGALIKRRRKYPFDLVIIDIMIRQNSYHFKTNKLVKNISYNDIHWEKSGVEFLRHIRNGSYEPFGFMRNVPVIAATAIVDSSVKDELERLGINSYLTKPFEPDLLMWKIKSAL